jgi:predicted DNA-binding protein (MmcQ/YjbR family)
LNAETFRNFCLSLPYATESLPFDEVTLCFKIANNKIFAILPLDTPDRVNLKCDPERAIELREQYASIIPGFHMNKKHWNTLLFHGDLDDTSIFELVKHSYDLVWKGLTKKVKNELCE